MYQNEYLFGDNILVAPLSCNQLAGKVYLPQGGWYRLSSGEFYKGNTEVTVDAPLNDLPVFVKASGIIPMQSDIQHTSQKPSPVLDIHLYNGNQVNSFVYYEDDGATYNYEMGQYFSRTITFDPQRKSLVFSKPEGSFSSKFSTYRIILHSFDDVSTFKSGSQTLSVKSTDKKERCIEIPASESEELLIAY
jgi:alpha-glucosidase